jgi:hypothetical protein
MPDNERFIDDLLDAALRVNLAPREGLEQRILANLKTAQSQPRDKWFTLPRMAFSAAAMAALVLVIWTLRPVSDSRHQTRPTVETTRVSLVHSTTASPQVTTKPRSEQKIRVRRKRADEASARAQTFPAPAGLSAQEQLLLSYLRRTPRSEVAFNSKPDPPRQDEPVEMNQAVPAQHSTSEATK